jgi:hypothetical protein
MELKTYGDLKKVIKAISLKQKGEKIGNIALDTISNFIPGADLAKNTVSFLKAAIGKPDTQKTKTWLDKLDIDDDMKAIIDDTVENGFLQKISKEVENTDNNKVLEPDFNMNQKMVDYLRDKYNQRTVTGIKENMKNPQLRKIIRNNILEILQEEEETNNTNKKMNSNVVAISKDLEDQTSSFKNINNEEIFTQLLDSIISKLSPEFKKSPGFKTAITKLYNKREKIQ